MDDPKPNQYELKLRILGNEVFAVTLSSSSDSNRWVAIGLATVFLLIFVMGVYGTQLVDLYKGLVN